MSLGEERELVPLGAGFDSMKRGYDRAQVDEHLERLDADLRMLTSDRDAAISQAGDLARQLEISRSEIDDLQKQVDRLAQPPTTLEGLSERLQRMLRLAQDEAADTRARAEAEAGHIRATAESDASAMRARYEQLLGELAERRKEMEAEHRGVLETARAEATEITGTATEERDRLDAESEQRRTQVEEDFEIAMATRRTEAMRVLAEQEATSKAEAERRLREATDEATAIRTAVAEEEATCKADVERRRRESVEDANRRKQGSISEANARLAEASDEAHRRVREATEEANRRIGDATERVETLQALRAQIADQVRAARTMLTQADAALGTVGGATAVTDDSPTHQFRPTRGGTPAPAPSPTPSPRKPGSEESGKQQHATAGSSGSQSGRSEQKPTHE
ncbi:chromosome segregation protein [Amycolatopsis antarctica]|uniref:Chromosome segregation protein n=1 Tax=Amycolatopsis antarctica TaxID=1854586 RepID=A0A263D6B1_9PSEU|nr:chromosome segregation protein [Amycolatopsis antarctica]OZM73911.1 chromosome segregation protein [Amycolatopsis antarctica]